MASEELSRRSEQFTPTHNPRPTAHMREATYPCREYPFLTTDPSARARALEAPAAVEEEEEEEG